MVSFQNVYDLEEDDDPVAPVPSKQMKFAASGGFLHHVVRRFMFYQVDGRAGGEYGLSIQKYFFVWVRRFAEVLMQSLVYTR